MATNIVMACHGRGLRPIERGKGSQSRPLGQLLWRQLNSWLYKASMSSSMASLWAVSSRKLASFPISSDVTSFSMGGACMACMACMACELFWHIELWKCSWGRLAESVTSSKAGSKRSKSSPKSPKSPKSLPTPAMSAMSWASQGTCLIPASLFLLSLESLKSLVSLVLGFRGWDSRTQASLDERGYRFWQISLLLPISLPICSPFCSFSPPISRAAPWKNALATRPCSRPKTSPSSEVGLVDEHHRHHRHHMHRNSRDSDPDWSKWKLHRLHLLRCEAQSIPKLEWCPARYPQSPQPAAPQPSTTFSVGLCHLCLSSLSFHSQSALNQRRIHQAFNAFNAFNSFLFCSTSSASNRNSPTPWVSRIDPNRHVVLQHFFVVLCYSSSLWNLWVAGLDPLNPCSPCSPCKRRVVSPISPYPQASSDESGIFCRCLDSLCLLFLLVFEVQTMRLPPPQAFWATAPSLALPNLRCVCTARGPVQPNILNKTGCLARLTSTKLTSLSLRTWQPSCFNIRNATFLFSRVLSLLWIFAPESPWAVFACSFPEPFEVGALDTVLDTTLWYSQECAQGTKGASWPHIKTDHLLETAAVARRLVRILPKFVQSLAYRITTTSSLEGIGQYALLLNPKCFCFCMRASLLLLVWHWTEAQCWHKRTWKQ